MADNTIIQQGTFLSDGSPKFIHLRSDIDWMRVYNYTNINTPVADEGVEFFWQRGMAINDGFVWQRNAAADGIDLRTSSDLAVSGFTLFNSSIPALSDLRATTGIDAGPAPEVTTADTSDLVPGDIVRIYNADGALQLGAMDFTVDTITGGSFELFYMRAIDDAVSAAGAGSYRRVQFGSMFYPRHRFITRVSQEERALVSMSVDHGFTVGQVVRFIVPKVRNSLAFGMIQLNELQGSIVSIGDLDADGFNNTIRVNIDTRLFDEFVFPLTNNVPFSPALVIPVGQDTGVTLSNGAYVLADSTVDESTIGIILGSGSSDALCPAGESGDSMVWVAGKSFAVDNQRAMLL